MYGYVAMFDGRRIELRAPSLYAAKLAALAEFKPRKRDEGRIAVVLAERDDGAPVAQDPAAL